jgi:hypothetical protein
MRRSWRSQDWSPRLIWRPTGRPCWKSRAGSGALRMATTMCGIARMTRIVVKCASPIAHRSWPRYVLWHASSPNKALTAPAVPINKPLPLSTASATRIATRPSTGSCRHAAFADRQPLLCFGRLRRPLHCAQKPSPAAPAVTPQTADGPPPAIPRSLSASSRHLPARRIENDAAVKRLPSLRSCLAG